MILLIFMIFEKMSEYTTKLSYSLGKSQGINRWIEYIDLE